MKDIFSCLDLLTDCVPKMYIESDVYGYDEECARTQKNLEFVERVLSFKRLATTANLNNCIEFMLELKEEFYAPVYKAACERIVSRLTDLLYSKKKITLTVTIS